MYWDGEKRTYVPAPSQTDSASAADSASLDASASKDKKDKPKTKTAQQVDMFVSFIALPHVLSSILLMYCADMFEGA